MFDNLSEKLDGIISKVKGYGKINEENISEMVREVRLALLEADVNYKIVGEFVNRVKEEALGEEVAKSLKPGEVFVSILRKELSDKHSTFATIKTNLTSELYSFISRLTGRNPIILPIIIDIKKEVDTEV